MARTFPLPAYTTAVQLNGVTKRKLSITSPGTTDSLATQGPAVTVAAAKSYYLTPESVASAGTLNAVGTAAGIGWALVPSDPGTLVPMNTDGWSLSAGNFTVQVTAARDAALTSADQACTFTAILFRANAAATAFAQELGRQTSASVTMTTTKTDFAVVVPTVATKFLAGDVLWLEIFASTTATSAAGSTASYSTNSATGCRVSSTTASYSTNYTKSLADTLPISDNPLRGLALARSISDSSLVSESIVRAVSFPRAIGDAMNSLSDTAARLLYSRRSLSEAVPVADIISRFATGARSLSDSVTVADSVARSMACTRALKDTLAAGNGTVVNNYVRPVLIFED